MSAAQTDTVTRRLDAADADNRAAPRPCPDLHAAIEDWRARLAAGDVAAVDEESAFLDVAEES